MRQIGEAEGKAALGDGPSDGALWTRGDQETSRPASESRRATSHDVAADSGVSQATVARVFSSPHLVATDTQAKVRASADRLGYVPNAIARGLKSQRTG